MTDTERSIALEAIDQLDQSQACSGCNDFLLEDTPENRVLVTEYDAYNVNVSPEDWPSHDEYHELRVHKGKLLTSDGIMCYVLKKNLGLLKDEIIRASNLWKVSELISHSP